MADPPSPRLDEDDAFSRDFNASPSPDAAPARSGEKRPFGDLYLYLYSHGEVSLAASQPVLLYAILLMILLSPFDMFYLSSRFYFLRTVWHIILPLQAMALLSSVHDAPPQIFPMTDGSVDDEHNICQIVKTELINRGSKSPRVSTFGLGSYCNHYFLRMLASIGKGHYDAALETGSIESRILG